MVDSSHARLVAAQFPLGSGLPSLRRLDRHGGFSGASLWHVAGQLGAFCLRAWPETMTPARLDHIQQSVRLARTVGGLDILPVALPTRALGTWVAFGGRLWELTFWLRGRADFHEQPTLERLQAACRALGRLHAAWDSDARATGPCPAVARRLRTYQRWRSLLDGGWQPVLGTGQLTDLARRTWDRVRAWGPNVPALLAPWVDRPLPLQPCHGDPWHGNLLFDGDELTGLLDFAETRLDSVAVDLARLLGSLVGDDDERWEAGLAAYHPGRPVTPQERELARALDRTGVLLGATNWLRWLYLDRRPFEDLDAVARRLGELTTRLESWRPGLIG